MATGVLGPGTTAGRAISAQRKVIAASALGTTFSWSDFSLFAALSPLIGQEFLPDADDSPFRQAIVASVILGTETWSAPWLNRAAVIRSSKAWTRLDVAFRSMPALTLTARISMNSGFWG